MTPAGQDVISESPATEMILMMTADEFTAGGYRFKDLQSAGIVSNRTDLSRKQRELGFPLPIKTGQRAAWFPRSEVHAWLKRRAALRDNSKK